MRKVAFVIVIVLGVPFCLIGIPLIINASYQCGTVIITTLWEAKDVLSYYGVLLAAAGAAIGVYLSVKKSQENYHDDVIRQVLPFIYVTPLSRKARVDRIALLDEDDTSTKATPKGGQAIEYEEYKPKHFYFVITSSGIELTKKLGKYQTEILENGGFAKSELKNGMKVPDYIDHFNLPLEIENVGKGAAVNLKIGFRRESNNAHELFPPRMLKLDETLNINIFSLLPYDKIEKKHILEFYYEDIYGNLYRQEFPVLFGKKENGEEYTSIDLIGKQVKL